MPIRAVATRNSFTSPFIGRAAELEALCNALPGSNGGRGRFATIVGEPGMGKTRLIAEFADIAESRSNHVLWSQMIEDPCAPPNFSWKLALRSYIQRIDNEMLLSDLGTGATDIAAMVPELCEQLSLETVQPAPDSATARYQLYDSVTRFLLRSAARKPLILLFDNLHSADRSSLAMLEYFCQQIAGNPILVVGAYRESETDRRHPLRQTLDRLSRSSGYMQVELFGLSRKEIAELLHSKLGYVPSASLVKGVLEQSGGNPLFATEVGAMLARREPDSQPTGAGYHFQVPRSLRDVINARLDTLRRDTYELLRAAAVLGRDFETALLSEFASLAPARVTRQLQEAELSGIVEPVGAGRFRFCHVIFREVLYAEHNTISRVRLHMRAGEQLERRYAEELTPHLSRLAYHYFEAAQVGGVEKAILYCRKAAEMAILQRAYGEAVALLDCALQVTELERNRDSGRRFDLLLAMGRAEYQAGELNAATRTLMKAAVLAHQNAWWERLGEAMYLFQLICQQSGFQHVASVPLHNAVLENLDEESVALRARVLTSLAKAYRTAARPELVASSFRQGVALARGCDDPAVLLDCLRKGNWTVGRSPETLRDGLDISREALALAIEQGKSGAALDSIVDIIFQLCDLGEIDEVQQQLAVLAQLAKAERQPHFRNVQTGFETAVAILRGDWNTALRKAHDGVRQLPLQGVRGLRGRFAFQVFAIRKMQGSLGQFKEVADRIITDQAESNLWLPGQILLNCELGESGEARKALLKLGDLQSLPDDDLLEIALIYLAESCLKLGDRQRCRDLYEFLQPYRGLNVTLPGTFMLGAVSGYLAQLAASLRLSADARELFEEALAMNSRMGAIPALARTQVEFACLLLHSGSERDRGRAEQLLAAARPAAESLGLTPVLLAINEVEATSHVESLTGREIDVLKNIAKGSSNKGIARALNISHSTVTTHVRNIFRKLGVANRTEAADFARRSGLLEHE